jgi:hypothetical protein
MLLSRHQIAGQNYFVKILNRLFENVSQFKYLGTTVRHCILNRAKIKRKLNSSIFCLLPYRYRRENIEDYNFACGFV